MEQKTYSVAEVREAMKKGEIRAYYQPQYDALTNRLTGAEALCRWIKPDGTVIMPGSFIPEMEKGDDIKELDWYMLRQVCALLRKQKERGLRMVHISVNFSRRHAGDEIFVEKLCSTLEEFGIDRKWIVLEITESALVQDGEVVLNQIRSLKEAGFTIAIDDFGSGLSSLSFVKKIPADVLKIDKSLLDGNCEDEKERIVLESIFSFAHRLKLSTVAEGVETRQQLGFFRTCGCQMIQGYLFARPMSEEDFLDRCSRKEKAEEEEDILTIQSPATAMQLLLDAVFIRYPLIIFANLTRNSYYMMAYENFTQQSCPSTGMFDELILHGASTMHPEDQEAFRITFDRHNQLKAHSEGARMIRLVTRQIGNDGIYRKVETANYFVKNPSVDDVLVITLCQNLED